MNLLAVWAPDAAQRRTILVDNPARLYGFWWFPGATAEAAAARSEIQDFSFTPVCSS